jgi:hypothetical protein
MASNTSVANMALGHLGFGTEIGDLTSETSEEASALKRFEDEALEGMLRDFDWSFTKTYADLQLVKTFDKDADPEYKEWGYSYRVPSDCVRIRKIYSGYRNDSLQSRVRYDLSSDDSGKLILTDASEGVLIYSKRIKNYDLFPTDFIMALSLKWALYVPNRLLAGDPFKIKNDLYNLYQVELANARQNDLMEQEFDEPVDSEFMRART